MCASLYSCPLRPLKIFERSHQYFGFHGHQAFRRLTIKKLHVGKRWPIATKIYLHICTHAHFHLWKYSNERHSFWEFMGVFLTVEKDQLRSNQSSPKNVCGHLSWRDNWSQFSDIKHWQLWHRLACLPQVAEGPGGLKVWDEPWKSAGGVRSLAQLASAQPTAARGGPAACSCALTSTKWTRSCPPYLGPGLQNAQSCHPLQ